MYKIIPKWEEERYYEQRDEAFAEAFDQIFEEPETHQPEPLFDSVSESESESETESVWEYDSQEDEDEDEEENCPFSFEYDDERLDELSSVQSEFNRYSISGLDPSEFVQAYAYGVILDHQSEFYEDFPTKEYMFVSKQGPKPRKTNRIAARTRPMGIVN